MFRYLFGVAVISLGLSTAACRCRTTSEEAQADAGTTPDASHISTSESGEKMVKSPSAPEPQPPPPLPGERRRPRGKAPHPEPTEPDPIEGEFTLDQATEGLQGEGPLKVSILADLARIDCTLEPGKAPRAVANFVGLARGKRPWWDPFRGEWVTRPFYSGLNFHAVIPGTKIEGGSLLSDGTGGPGFSIEPELTEGFGHDEAGVLSLVADDDGTVGSRFLITDGPAPQFNGRHVPIGRCEPVDAVFRIARVPQAGGNRPLTDVLIRGIRAARGE